MKEKKTLEIVIPKKFYSATEIANLYQMSVNEVKYEAAKVNALYRIQKCVLVNKEIFEQKYVAMMDLIEKHEGEFIQIKEAVHLIGLPERQVIQIASDAEALIVIGREFLVNLSDFKKYLISLRAKVQVFTLDESDNIVD